MRIHLEDHAPRALGLVVMAALREDDAALGVEERVVRAAEETLLDRQERAGEIAARATGLGEQRVEARALGIDGERLHRALLGKIALPHAQRESRDGLEEIGVLGRVGGRAEKRAERGVGELLVGRHEGRDVERERRETACRKPSVRGVADCTTEMHHRGEAIVGTAAERVVEGAALRAKNALEGLPREIADVADRSELRGRRVELGPQLVEGREQRAPGILAVDLRLDLRARAAVLGLEDEQLDEAAAVGRRLERARDDEAHAVGLGARARQVLPGARRDERLDRAGLGARVERLAVVVVLLRIIVVVVARAGRTRTACARYGLAGEELRERDALAVDLREAVDERGKPKAQSTSIIGDAERDHHGSRARHHYVSCRELNQSTSCAIDGSCKSLRRRNRSPLCQRLP